MATIHLRLAILIILATFIFTGCVSSPVGRSESGPNLSLSEEPDHGLSSQADETQATTGSQAVGQPTTSPEWMGEGEPTGTLSAPPVATQAMTPAEDPSPLPNATMDPKTAGGAGETADQASVLPAVCPAPGGNEPTITVSDEKVGLDVMFTPQILAYLNTRGSADGLEAALSSLTIDDGWAVWQSKAQVHTIDVTGDTTPDIVMDLSFFVEGQYTEGNLYLFRCEAGQYIGGSQAWILGQVLTAEEIDPGIRAIRDMNGNGLPEIVYSYIGNIGTHANFGRQFHILEWDGDQLQELIQGGLIEPNAAEVINGDGEIRDYDGDGLLDLVLSHGSGHGPEANPHDRTHTDIWTWNGKGYTESCSEYAPPIYRFQAVLDGDEATRCDQPDRALALYQQAIFDEALLGWQGNGAGDNSAAMEAERQLLSAYSRYRILLLHAHRGYEREARIVYDTLRSKFPPDAIGYPYVELATEFWDEYTASGDTGQACGEAITYAEAHAGEILNLGSISITDTLAICPFE